MAPKKKPPAKACADGFQNLFTFPANGSEDNPQGLAWQLFGRHYGRTGLLSRIVVVLIEVGKVLA